MSADESQGALPPTPDFDCYAVPAAIASALPKAAGRELHIEWSDGRRSRYHAIWLRDNATDPHNLNLETREQNTDVTALPRDLAIRDARVDAAGVLVLRWTPCGTSSRFHPGWLHAHDYENTAPHDDAAVAPASIWEYGWR